MTRPAEKIVHARLDPETEVLMRRLRRRTGLNDSEIVRQAVRALAAQELVPRPSKIVGLGRFASGIDDLGSNERHLDDFGES